MNSVKNHWGGEVIHGTPRPSEESIEVKDRNSLEDGDSFTYEGKEWIQVRELTPEEVQIILKDRLPCLSPTSR
tara:strand:+ start:1911 stop:2129 length:219 start_codon:yes stop_codon:yes gene_type:complete